jgi:hypothetical protein
MADYSFYTDVYMGCELGQKDFSALAARAEELLDRFLLRYRGEVSGPESRSMAICAMAEVLRHYKNRDGLAQATVGGVSVRYSDGSQARMKRELYDRASIYVDFHRGLGQ